MSTAKDWASGLFINFLPAEGFELSEWDRLLIEMGIDERQAERALRRGDSQRATRLRAFIYLNAYRRFIPEWALSECGLKVSVNFRFPSD